MNPYYLNPSTEHSPGLRFREALKEEKPLQIVGTINANHALLATQAGFKAIYLSGGGVAAGSLGIPDLGITTLEDVLVDVQRITNVTATPLLVDIDTGFGPSAFNIARTIRSLIKAGAAAIHIEDQVGAKRCGHRPGKELVSKEEMADRIKAAVDARTDPGFVIGARTDAFANEGLEKTLDRAVAYQEAGADFIFAEAIADLGYYQKFVNATGLPVLANITEFGMIPLYTLDQLRDAGVGLALYPLSAFRAANKAAQNVFRQIRQNGTQQGCLDSMQTREELYQSIGYHEYERHLDQLFKSTGYLKGE
jgi:methylisocitrate lyase